MGRYEVRTDNGFRLVESLEELRRQARVGQIKPDEKCRPEGGTWVSASAMPELKGSFNLDLWSAWEDEDAGDEPTPQAQAQPAASKASPKAPQTPAPPTTSPAAPPRPPAPPASARPPAPPPAPPSVTPPRASSKAPPAKPAPSDKMTSGHLTELPSEAIHPVGDVHPPKIVDLPPAALQPLPEPSRASRGLVIAFPPNGDRSRRGGAQPAVAPLELDPPRPLPPGLARPLNVPPPPAAFPWRWVVYGALILAVTLITGGTVWYVRSLASWTAPDHTPEPVADAVSAPPIVRSPGAPEMVDSEDLTALLKELRGRLSLETVESDPDGEGLADALFIELRRLISVKDTHVQVLRMTQTRRPEPLTVEVRVWVNTQGDVYRELGAVGLVVGKMLYQLSLEAPVVEAILVSEDGTTRKRAIRGEAALALYRGEMDLRSFLVDAPPEPGAGTQSP